jgi:hypothetical protein
MLLIAVAAFFFQIVLQYNARPYAKEGLYYQEWSSEVMMQTVPIEALRDAPIQSLLNLHIQPPALDLIRAILAGILASSDSHLLLRNVDRSIYVLWALVCGLMAAVIFLWLSKTTQIGFASLATIFFAAHPALIYYATLLESTFLSTFLILLTYYLLWNIRECPQKPLLIFTFAAAVLALFFTRSLFQWPSIFLFALSLFLLKVPTKQIVLFLIVCGVFTGAYLGKQYYKFGTLSTFGWSGLNICRAIASTDRYNMHSYVSYIDVIKNTEEQERSLPIALRQRYKISGTPNLNHLSYVGLNKTIMEYCKNRLRYTPVLELLISYVHNVWIYFQPSSRYITPHVIVDQLPWRAFYDCLFSFPILPGLLLFAGLSWLAKAKGGDFIVGFALALPGIYIFLVSVLGEKGENMRLKFFLEPVMFIFIASQIYALVRQFYHRFLPQALHLTITQNPDTHIQHKTAKS